MFERYTEKARRAIFFARHEASSLGSAQIETEHLLLGLLHEDENLRAKVAPSSDALVNIRSRIEALKPGGKVVPLSADLPLSDESKRVLASAAAEAGALQHRFIGCGHLVLGLFQVKNSVAANLLEECGVRYTDYVEFIRNTLPPSPDFPAPPLRPGQVTIRPAAKVVFEPALAPPPQRRPLLAPSLAPVVLRLETLVNRTLENLNRCSERDALQYLKRKELSRKEALGHLIDLATALHGWLGRAITETRLHITDYPSEDLAQVQDYNGYQWPGMLNLWSGLNRLSLHGLSLIPEEKLNIACHVGVEQSVTLLQLVERYVNEIEDISGQMIARL